MFVRKKKYDEDTKCLHNRIADLVVLGISDMEFKHNLTSENQRLNEIIQVQASQIEVLTKRLSKVRKAD
jgi:hypothetical protein